MKNYNHQFIPKKHVILSPVQFHGFHPKINMRQHIHLPYKANPMKPKANHL